MYYLTLLWIQINIVALKNLWLWDFVYWLVLNAGESIGVESEWILRKRKSKTWSCMIKKHSFKFHSQKEFQSYHEPCWNWLKTYLLWAKQTDLQGKIIIALPCLASTSWCRRSGGACRPWARRWPSWWPCWGSAARAACRGRGRGRAGPPPCTPPPASARRSGTWCRPPAASSAPPL